MSGPEPDGSEEDERPETFDDDDAAEIHEAAELLGFDESDERLKRRTERRELLREAALYAELTTGAQERTEEAARRNIVLRLGTIVVGFVVLLSGLAMIVLPGPGIVVIIIGLGLLARELPWAARLLEYAKKKAKVDELKSQPRWVQAAMWTGTVAAVTASMVYVFAIR